MMDGSKAQESPGTFVAKPELKAGDAWYVGRPDMGSFVLLEAGSPWR